MIIVIDYDVGNTANMLKVLQKIGVQTELSGNRDKILAADGLILPGVGAYSVAMAGLQQRNLVSAIKEAITKRTPLLGICLGVQVLTGIGLEYQETQELGFIPGVCREIQAAKIMPVPYMGWNDLTMKQDSPLTAGLIDKPVYFVHSYFTDAPKKYIDATADYGIEVSAMIHKDDAYGAQFYPEKSGDVGLGTLEESIALCGN